MASWLTPLHLLGLDIGCNLLGGPSQPLCLDKSPCTLLPSCPVQPLLISSVELWKYVRICVFVRPIHVNPKIAWRCLHLLLCFQCLARWVALSGELNKQMQRECWINNLLGFHSARAEKRCEDLQLKLLPCRWKRDPSLSPKPPWGRTWLPAARRAQHLTRDRLEGVQRSGPGRIKWRERVIYKER